MTRAEMQAERFRNTACPAKPSRKKMRAVANQNTKLLTRRALRNKDNPFAGKVEQPLSIHSRFPSTVKYR